MKARSNGYHDVTDTGYVPKDVGFIDSPDSMSSVLFLGALHDATGFKCMEGTECQFQ